MFFRVSRQAGGTLYAKAPAVFKTGSISIACIQPFVNNLSPLIFSAMRRQEKAAICRRQRCPLTGRCLPKTEKPVASAFSLLPFHIIAAYWGRLAAYKNGGRAPARSSRYGAAAAFDFQPQEAAEKPSASAHLCSGSRY